MILNMNTLALDKTEKIELKKLISKPLEELTDKEKEVFLRLGAKDFSIRLGDTIKKLADE